MAQYFTRVPKWVIGIARIVLRVAVAAGAIATFTTPKAVLFLMVIREVVGAFVEYSEKEKATEPKSKV